MLERIAIGALITSLMAYIGVVVNFYLLQGRSADWSLALIVFVIVLRAKIGLDDAHYYSARIRKSSAADRAVVTSLLSYVFWVTIPLQAVWDVRRALLLTSFTILLSTVSIAFTALDLENQLEDASRSSPVVAAGRYAALQRFYDEQPMWIINNCMYEGCLLALVYFSPLAGLWPWAAFAALFLLVVKDFVRSGPISYITGSRVPGNAIHCPSCTLYLGTTNRADSFCPNCGTASAGAAATVSAGVIAK
jgi:hypothetical protein